MTTIPQNLAEELGHFHGTEHYYNIPMFRAHITDGVRHLCNYAQWMVTDILSVVRYQKKTRMYYSIEGFIAVTFTVKNSKARAEYTNGNGVKCFAQIYKYTDVPDGVYKFFFAGDVLMLAGEY